MPLTPQQLKQLQEMYQKQNPSQSTVDKGLDALANSPLGNLLKGLRMGAAEKFQLPPDQGLPVPNKVDPSLPISQQQPLIEQNIKNEQDAEQKKKFESLRQLLNQSNDSTEE